MFTNKSNVKTPRDSAVTILTAGCHFSGKLYCRGSSRIAGKIEGEIISEGLLIIEQGAVIQADISAEEVIIQGSVKGRVSARQRMELSPSCRFEGNISATSLVIHEGAVFNGSSHMPSKASGGQDEIRKLEIHSNRIENPLDKAGQKQDKRLDIAAQVGGESAIPSL